MSDKKIKRISRAEIEKRQQQQRRAKITLLRLLIEEMPEDAKRLVQSLRENAV
jgi:hypothetical protein